MSLLDLLEAECPPEPATKPRPKVVSTVAPSSIGPFEAVNAIDTLAVLDWCGIEHESTGRGETARCPGCGEPGALVCEKGGIKCLHDRCSNVGPTKFPGFRSNADIVQAVFGCTVRDSVDALAKQFCVETHWKGDKSQAPKTLPAPPPDDDWTPSDFDAPDAPPQTSSAPNAPPVDAPLHSVADLSGAVLSLIEARAKGIEKPVPVPFAHYQIAMNGGIWCGSNETVVGLTGSMKSQFVSQKTIYAAKAGIPCLLVTLELVSVQASLRLMCDFAEVSWSRCEDGRATAKDLDSLRAAKPQFDQLPIKVEYGLPQVFTPAALEYMIERYRKEVQGPIYVVVDFAQLLGTEVQGQEARERVGNVFYGLQGVARRTGVAMTAVSSTARQNYGLLSDVEQAAKLYIDQGQRLVGNPAAVLAAAKESGEAEYASDTLWVLCKWPSKLDNGDQLIIAVQGKRRFGLCCWFAMAAHNGRLREYRVDSMNDLPSTECTTAEDYVATVVATVARKDDLRSANDIVKAAKVGGSGGKRGEMLAAVRTAIERCLIELFGGVFRVVPGGSREGSE